MKYVYLIQELESKRVKIGFSKHPQKRLTEHQIGNGDVLKLLYTFPSIYASKIEASFKSKYKRHREHGEWFNLTQLEINNFLTFCKQRHNNFVILSKTNFYDIY